MIMKLSKLITSHFIKISFSIITIIATVSCGSTSGISNNSNSDGIYDSEDDYRITQNSNQTSTPPQTIAQDNYFSRASSEMDTYNQNEVFTDPNSYSSYNDDNIENNTNSTNEYNLNYTPNYDSWSGVNDNTTIDINFMVLEILFTIITGA